MNTVLKATKIAKKGDALLDLAFVIDCTASMDPYIIEARDNIIGIVNEIVDSENCDVRLALVEYRDHPPCDETFVTKVHDFTEIPGEMKNWLRQCHAGGGGDIPEAVPDALNEVLKLSWREKATKISVFVTDAPPHGLGTWRDKFPEGCPIGLDPMDISRDLAAKGVTLYVAGCEPSILAYKHFYLAIAHVTGGQYIPLEDAQSLVPIITIGAREEMSLKNLESEVEKEVVAMAKTGRVINEKEIASLLHSRWEKSGVHTRQLTLNKQHLDTADSSDTAMKITKMNFDAVKTLYKTTSPKTRKQADDEARKVSREQGNISSAEIDEMVSDALANLQTSSTTLTVDFSTITESDRLDLGDDQPHTDVESQGQVDFGPAPSQEVPRKVDLSRALGASRTAEANSGEGQKKGSKGNFQCIDGAVTMSQTMRLVQKSVNKMARTNPGQE